MIYDSKDMQVAFMLGFIVCQAINSILIDIIKHHLL